MVRELELIAIRLHILHHAAEGEIYGAWMAEELGRHGYSISPGTLYPTLHRMESDGLVVSEPRVVDGRRQRVYTATRLGASELEDARRALQELAKELL